EILRDGVMHLASAQHLRTRLDRQLVDLDQLVAIRAFPPHIPRAERPGGDVAHPPHTSTMKHIAIAAICLASLRAFSLSKFCAFTSAHNSSTSSRSTAYPSCALAMGRCLMRAFRISTIT